MRPPTPASTSSPIFDTIEEWTKTKTKFEVMDILNESMCPADRSCR